jgi:hypothetical protein
MNNIIAWLGRSFLIKTFDNQPECDLDELRSLLEESDEDEAPQC